MKALIYLALTSSLAAFGAESRYAVSCATTNGFFSGTKTVESESANFSGSDLKDILLGEKQTQDLKMPFPSDIAVAPQIGDLQDVALNLGQAQVGYQKTVYFTLNGKNFLAMPVFCTISQSPIGF